MKAINDLPTFERSGWRDAGISMRHRFWGYDCPAIDIDFILAEYDNGKAVALIEYKNEHAKPQKIEGRKQYAVLMDLCDRGNRGELPLFSVRYKDDYSRFLVVPINDGAKKIIPKRTVMKELEYVTFLYRIRGRNIPEYTKEWILEQHQQERGDHP